MWKWSFTPSWLRNELRNCYDKYSNDLHYIDKRLIHAAYMKFPNIWNHSIKKYLRISKWCVSFFFFFCWVYYPDNKLHLFNFMIQIQSSIESRMSMIVMRAAVKNIVMLRLFYFIIKLYLMLVSFDLMVNWVGDIFQMSHSFRKAI